MRTAHIFHGDCREVLRSLPEAAVHCVVTSPPYYGLRDYGLEPIWWGGDSDHEHQAASETTGRRNGRDWDPTVGASPVGRDYAGARGTYCGCGAWRGCLGLEPTPELYIEHMVEVFREVRRVLRSDGVLFLNLGDSYAAGGRGGLGDKCGLEGSRHSQNESRRAVEVLGRKIPSGYKAGDLMGLPWAVAFALRADGWWLRSDVVWSKPNPMPESVAGVRWERHRVKVGPSRWAEGEKKGLAWEAAGKPGGARGREKTPGGSSSFDSGAEWEECPGCPTCDPNDGLVLRRGSWRPTKSHEYVFLLAPSEDYFANGEAVREADSGSDHPRNTLSGQPSLEPAEGLLPPHRGLRKAVGRQGAGRNLRSVWTIATHPFPEAHFATFPPTLVEPCIKAGTAECGCCRTCGAPWAPVVRASYVNVGNRSGNGPRSIEMRHKEFGSAGYAQRLERRSSIEGWRPTCGCRMGDAAPPRPSVVLDPFGGSGTVAEVALALGREAILIEANPAYVKMAEARVRGAAPLLNRIEIHA